MSKKFIVVGLGIIFVGLIIFSLVESPWNSADGNEKKVFEIKDQLGGFTLTNKVSGADALEQINYLHGKSVEIEAGYILNYETDNGLAIVWISMSSTEEEAEKLFHKMNDIMGESAMYTDHSEVEIGGTPLQYVFGMDMDNYYYFIDNRVVWISITGDDDNQFMEEAVESF